MVADSAQKQERFMEKMTQVLNLGALNLALAMGYRLELFEVLASQDKAMPCSDLARLAAVSPRYLREWLGVMVCGGVVELSRDEQGTELYRLPPEHAACLVRGSDLNMGVYTQEIPLLTRLAQTKVTRRFVDGNGVPFEDYPEFQGFMADLADAKHHQTLVEVFLPSVDQGRLLPRLEAGIAVCDLGCGAGMAARLMAQAFPKSSVVGLDISPQAIEAARMTSDGLGLDNLCYEVMDAAKLADYPEWHRRFDYITAFDAIHDQTRPLKALQGIKQMLKPGGLFSMIDIKAGSRHSENLDHPLGAFLYTVSLMHCLPVGLDDGGAGLGMMWGSQTAREMLEEAGFSHAELVDMPFDPFNQHYLCRP